MLSIIIITEQPKVVLLRERIRSLRDVPLPSLLFFSMFFTQTTVSKDTLLYGKGDYKTKIYIMLSGRAVCRLSSRDANNHSMYITLDNTDTIGSRSFDNFICRENKLVSRREEKQVSNAEVVTEEICELLTIELRHNMVMLKSTYVDDGDN